MAEIVFLLNTHSPKSLYELCVARIVDLIRTNDFPHYEDLTILPPSVIFDLYYEMYMVSSISCCSMLLEWSNLKIFSKMLVVTSRHVDLLTCFEDFIRNGIMINEELTERYIMCCNSVGKHLEAQDRIINLGLRLGRFLSDAGCYPNSEQILLECQKLCLLNNSTPENWCRTLDCCQRLLHTQATYCLFNDALKTFLQAVKIWKQLKKAEFECNLAAFYKECSLMFYMMHKYDEAYSWSTVALMELKPTLPARVTVDVLRQAAKSCIHKHEFQKAGLLITQAIQLARNEFVMNHPVFTNAFLDYGFYLLKADHLLSSVQVYREAIDSMSLLSQLHVALANVDLAYARYTYEYDTGSFNVARTQIESAICTMKKLLGKDHFLLASANRVYALILEEIAIIDYTTPMRYRALFHAECLHQSALHRTKKTLGENNALTAKHYGNLGRLYQTMGQYEKAEEMHIKAIRIKEESLGPDDHEVALSIGHLASLYNFNMHRYEDAEKLYHRSIAICLKLFGKSYSGLDCDYRGLLHLYTQRNELEKVRDYEILLNDLRVLRGGHYLLSEYQLSIAYDKCPDPIEEVIDQFFAM